ncbi:MAG: manganese-dependent inorganic pyrophosphatase, partial [Desulfovibrionaceae bacterium]|nr:manganese-dependent inorganic pyrophosphatase [Desulfovibrionaceae bacterium]
TILLLLTDIMKEGSLVLFLSDETNRLENVFKKEFQGNSLWIDGMMSRKKQVMPYLQKMFDE